MKDLVHKRRLDARFTIASAATCDINNGLPVHHGTRDKLREHGISCAGKTARQLTRSDYDHYDLLIGMDGSNLRNMRAICGGDPDGKIVSLLSFCGEAGDVADPWYTGDFEQTWVDVLRGCEALLDTLVGKEA